MPKDFFLYHRPTEGQVARMTAIREAARSLRDVIEASAPASAERTLSLRELELCVMRANQSIMINEE